jgi:acyl-coenzyme A synthetase/AMP-(fatty) acid ligase/thioesterase domain-containing protein/acyl carrier protein
MGQERDLVQLTASPSFSIRDLVDDYWGCVNTIIQSSGDRRFVVTTKGTLTFSEADRHANIIWAAICGQTNLSHNGIGLFLKDPLEIIPAMMGVLKSGNYIVPLDVGFPESTLAAMVEIAEIKAFLTRKKYTKQIQSILGDGIPLIFLDDLDVDGHMNDSVVRYSPADVVQILFTSGSTGQPKGAIEDYRYLLRAVSNRVAGSYYHVDDRHLQLSTFTFSGPHTRVFTSLVSGNSLYYYDLKEDGMAGLPAWIRQQEITFYSSTPTVFRSFIGMLAPTDVFPSVVKFSGGGEKKLHSDIQAIRRHFPNVKKIRLGFGSTETQNVASSYFPVDHDFSQQQLPSGKPAKDIQVFIWDENGNPLPSGQEGEIVVYGGALVRGYINNPTLTQERFIPDPLNPGWQYFKTGDLGKLLPDGQLVHLGRIDNMVKIKGVRIEVDAIENHVLSYPGILQVASRAVEGENDSKRLATYFVSEKGIEIPISDLRKHLAERLPRHQLPHYLIPLENIPTIPGRGKVDKSRLPLPKMERPNLSNPCLPPANELEKRLLQIWEEELGIKGIGVTDDFFDVGGDSLIGVLLFVRIEKELGRKLPVSILLTASTVRQQAELINNLAYSQNISLLIPIRIAGDQPPLFFIPGKGAYPIRIRHLEKSLSLQTPIYALQYLEPSQGKQELNFTEYIASLYVNEIRKLFPQGPYILVGESWGGKVAFEMAQQFRKLGEDVPVLALLDTYLNISDPELKSGASLKWYWMLIRKHLSILFESDFKGKMEYLRFYRENGWRKLLQLMREWFERKKKMALQVSEEDVALPAHVRELEKRNRQESRNYVPQAYVGRVLLFKALRSSAARLPANGWEEMELGELIVHELDCYHGSILFEPAVTKLAQFLQIYIDDLNHQRRDESP